MSEEKLSYTIWRDRYALKDPEGNVLETSINETWKRVATAVASAEKHPTQQRGWSDTFYDALNQGYLVPGGRIIAGAGSGFDVTLMNCYVTDYPHDSRQGVLTTVAQLTEMMSRGGGVGVNISSLRPKGTPVRKVGGTSSGSVNWASIYSIITRDIIQVGGQRRGANLLLLEDWHPDIPEFIRCKKDTSKLTGSNISVGVSHDLMNAIKNDEDWDFIFPDTTDPEYDEKWNGRIKEWKAHGKKVVVHNTIKARELWDQLCEGAWDAAEPGLIFVDRVREYHNVEQITPFTCVNPCAEEPLEAFGACNLAALNLNKFVVHEDFPAAGFDYQRLAEYTKIGQRFLDNVLDITQYPLEENMATQRDGIRRTGLGIMGLADALIRMRVRYGSDDSIIIIEKIFKTIRDAAYETSCELAKEKGAFPKFDPITYGSKFIWTLPDHIKKMIFEGDGIRNSVLLTLAPTGTTSLLAETSSGIEPVFDYKFTRVDRLGQHDIYHPAWDEYIKTKQDFPEWLVTSNELTPEEHIKTQAAAQKYIDASISKTVNLPNTATVDDVKTAYNLSYEMGLKTVALYVDGSRNEQILYHEDSMEHIKEKHGDDLGKDFQLSKDVESVELKPRPDILRGITYRKKTPVGTAYIILNVDDNNEPFEVFIEVGKAGSDIAADAEAIGRLISLVLRVPSNMPASHRLMLAADQLDGIGGGKFVGLGPNQIRSLADAVGQAIKSHEQADDTKKTPTTNVDICPECGVASLVRLEGCSLCQSCGYSAC